MNDKADGWAGTIAGMPKEGAAAERSKTVGMRDIELFTEITGDQNPLHYDERAARESLFKGLIVQGGVTSGMLNAIVAQDLPGPGTVFLSMELKFVKAVYVGETITARVEIMSVWSDKSICTIAVSVRNQKGDLPYGYRDDLHRAAEDRLVRVCIAKPSASSP
jgi:acyl dehydratase